MVGVTRPAVGELGLEPPRGPPRPPAAPRDGSLPRPSVQRRKQRLRGSSSLRPHSAWQGGGPWVTLWLGVTTVGRRTRGLAACRGLCVHRGPCPPVPSPAHVRTAAPSPSRPAPWPWASSQPARPPRDRAPSHRAVTASESQAGAVPDTRCTPGVGRWAWASVSPCLKGWAQRA